MRVCFVCGLKKIGEEKDFRLSSWSLHCNYSNIVRQCIDAYPKDGCCI